MEPIAGQDKEPSIFNSEAVKGGLLASVLAIAATAVIELFTEKTLDFSSDIFGFLPVAGVVLAVVAAVAIGGAYLGGKSGQKRQEREIEEARHQQISQHMSQNVSPEIGQAAEYTMANNDDWGKKMLEEKSLAVTQENTRQ